MSILDEDAKALEALGRSQRGIAGPTLVMGIGVSKPTLDELVRERLAECQEGAGAYRGYDPSSGKPAPDLYTITPLGRHELTSRGR